VQIRKDEVLKSHRERRGGSREGQDKVGGGGPVTSRFSPSLLSSFTYKKRNSYKRGGISRKKKGSRRRGKKSATGLKTREDSLAGPFLGSSMVGCLADSEKQIRYLHDGFRGSPRG